MAFFVLAEAHGCVPPVPWRSLLAIPPGSGPTSRCSRGRHAPTRRFPLSSWSVIRPCSTPAPRRSASRCRSSNSQRPATVPALFSHALPVIPIAGQDRVVAGRPDRSAAPLVTQSIERAVELVRQGAASRRRDQPHRQGRALWLGLRLPGTHRISRRSRLAAGKTPASGHDAREPFPEEWFRSRSTFLSRTFPAC